MINNDEYIHPQSIEIKRFTNQLQLNYLPLNDIAKVLFNWFDEHILYSRLNAPFYPLQRSDIDVLNMQSGTCGDYSNLIVSVLTRLGYETKYAYVHDDYYGNPQDHICVAVYNEGRWILIDATQPYRKWHGFDCPHKEYELLSYDEIRTRLKKRRCIGRIKHSIGATSLFRVFYMLPGSTKILLTVRKKRLKLCFSY